MKKHLFLVGILFLTLKVIYSFPTTPYKLLIVYTKNAKAQYNQSWANQAITNPSRPQPTSIEAYFRATVISGLNNTYQSNFNPNDPTVSVIPRVELAGVVELDWDETGLLEETVLDMFIKGSPPNPKFDVVKGLRDYYSADVVALIGIFGIGLASSNGGVHSNGYRSLSSPSHCYILSPHSIMWAKYENDFGLFAHEIGHTFGCHHVESSGPSKGYQYQDAQGKFGTILSYWIGPKLYSTRDQTFTYPHPVTQSPLPIGNAGADCAYNIHTWALDMGNRRVPMNDIYTSNIPNGSVQVEYANIEAQNNLYINSEITGDGQKKNSS